jgi:hypothetical protein
MRPLATSLDDVLAPPAELRELAGRPGGVTVGVVGGSMMPAVKAGETVVVRRARYLLPGDAFLFESKDGACVLHRVLVEVPVLGWVFQAGDTGSSVGVVRRDRVIGRAAIPRRLPHPRRFASATRLALSLSARAILGRR